MARSIVVEQREENGPQRAGLYVVVTETNDTTGGSSVTPVGPITRGSAHAQLSQIGERREAILADLTEAGRLYREWEDILAQVAKLDPLPA